MSLSHIKRFETIEKSVGETPLQAAEHLRSKLDLSADTSMAYAGRLDPMATGKLLILIGDECKKQTNYHSLDKEYEFEVLFGISSDTGDVLGLLDECTTSEKNTHDIKSAISGLTGDIELPYPHFSSKTVRGKPLHIWTLEGRINEIEIPTKKSKIYKLEYLSNRFVSKDSLHKSALEKINSIPKVTEESKKLGADFRRGDVRPSWEELISNTDKKEFQIVKFRCIASSGTYMRTLAEVIAKELSTCGLAYGIHRTKIGKYSPVFKNLGYWSKKY